MFELKKQISSRDSVDKVLYWIYQLGFSISLLLMILSLIFEKFDIKLIFYGGAILLIATPFFRIITLAIFYHLQQKKELLIQSLLTIVTLIFLILIHVIKI